MAYVDQNGTGNRATAAIGVIAIHVALGGLVITGLSTVVPKVISDGPLLGENIEVELDPPPKPDDPEVEQPVKQKKQDIFAPDNPFKFETDADVATTDDLADKDEFVTDPDPLGSGTTDPAPRPKPTPKPTPTFDPIVAKPSNDPSAWVTNNDYRTMWVRREYQGTVGFSLSVGVNGRVEDCRITRSSGHGELDDATCRLIKQRARFTSARDGKGMKVPGSYANSVRWQLPD